MILVTGGTGLVGSHLLYNLTSQNKKVRAIFRRSHKLENVKKVFSYYTNQAETLFNLIDWVEGDITNIPSLETAFKGITQVYHCAAFVSFEPDKYYQLRKINIEGTANVVNQCIARNIKKLCYVSSVAATGQNKNPNQLINEDTLWDNQIDHSVYAITKYGAEIEVWRGTQEGIDAVIVNPGVIIGPGFWKGGGSSSLINKIYKGLPYYTTGVTGFVGVWDVVQVMQDLMASSLKNERYILVSENMSFQDFINKTAKQLAINPPKKEAKSVLLEIGWRLDWLRHKCTGKRRRLSKQMAKSTRTKTLYDATKIKDAINFKFETLDKALETTCRLFLKDQ